MTAIIATKASPPGRFSTTTVWPHFADSLSAKSRAVMSTPEPGPSGMTNLTVRCGQVGVCADDSVEDSASATMKPMQANDDRRLGMLSPGGKAERYKRTRMHLVKARGTVVITDFQPEYPIHR